MLRWDFFVQIQPKRASKRINAEKCKKKLSHTWVLTRISVLYDKDSTHLIKSKHAKFCFFLLYSQLLTWHHLPRSSVPAQTYPYSTYSLENFHPRAMMKNKYCVKPDRGDIQHFRDVMNDALGYLSGYMPYCHTNLLLLAHTSFVWNSMENFLTFRMQNMFQILWDRMIPCLWKKKFHRKEHRWADFWSAGQSATITAKWNAYLATSIHKPFHWRDTSSSHRSRYI